MFLGASESIGTFAHGDLQVIRGLMFKLDHDKPAASVLWPETKALSLRVLSHTCMPLILGEHVFAAMKTRNHRRASFSR